MMSAAQPWIILLARGDWRVLRGTEPGSVVSEPVSCESPLAPATARQIAERLHSENYSGSPVLIGLDAGWCPSVSFPLPDGRGARKHQALIYQLEPHLPWAAEDLVADFERHAGRAFGSALAVEGWNEFLQELERAGVSVVSISPWSRLALAQHLLDHPRLRERYMLLWGSHSGLELWSIDRDRPEHWIHLPRETPSLLRTLRQRLLQDGSPLDLYVRNVPPEFLPELRNLPGIAVHEIPECETVDHTSSAFWFAGRILQGDSAAPWEFRRDELAREKRHRELAPHWVMLQVSLLCLLAAFGYAAWEQSLRYDTLRRTFQDRQAALFSRVFPNTPVPVGVRSRLESERARLSGLRGNDAGDSRIVPAARIMEQLLRSLPRDLRYRILEVRIDGGRLYVVGQVREHADADRIAEELRKAKLLVDPPTTHRLPERGVEFRISAKSPVESRSPPGGST